MDQNVVTGQSGEDRQWHPSDVGAHGMWWPAEPSPFPKSQLDASAHQVGMCGDELSCLWGREPEVVP